MRLRNRKVNNQVIDISDDEYERSQPTEIREDDNNTQILENLRANVELTDLTIEKFRNLINKTTGFFMQDTLYFQNLSKYIAAPEDRNDIQILFSTRLRERSGHWIFLHYVTEERTLYVYDSLYLCHLNRNQTQIVGILYPKREKTVFVEPTLIQKDGTSCGVFALAYAISFALGKHPFEINFTGRNVARKLRKHLIDIFMINTLMEFPENI